MFPYAPKVYRDYLTPKMPGVRIAGDVPKDRPNRLVTIRTAPAGSTTKPRFLALRRLIFQTWDDDEITAGELCETLRDHVVKSIFAGIGVQRVSIIGEPSRFNDPDDSRPRFQMTVDVLLRAKH